VNLFELIQKSEMRFWDFTIPILESEATPVRKFLNFGYHSYQRYRLMNFILKSFFWASIGLTFGLALGLIVG